MGVEYIILGAIVVIALLLDFFVFTSKGQEISFRSAAIQSAFWVILSLVFGYYVYELMGRDRTLEYYVAYVMEKSLSVDNIVVFILIFKSFRVKRQSEYMALTIGILLAIVMRIVFIVLGVALVSRFELLLVFFGLFLIYTSYRMMFAGEEEEDFNPQESRVFRFLSKRFRINMEDDRPTFLSRIGGKRALSKLGLVVLMIAFSDFIFALDSLPTVLGISQDQYVILSSNILAVLGLRALFYLMQNAVERFRYLTQGVALVLFFIGAKLVLGFLGLHIDTAVSLAVVLITLGASIVYSVIKEEKDA